MLNWEQSADLVNLQYYQSSGKLSIQSLIVPNINSSYNPALGVPNFARSNHFWFPKAHQLCRSLPSSQHAIQQQQQRRVTKHGQNEGQTFQPFRPTAPWEPRPKKGKTPKHALSTHGSDLQMCVYIDIDIDIDI